MRIRYPATTAAGTLLIVLGALYWATGGLHPELPPGDERSSRQIIGMSLMLILMPAYLLAAVIAARRYSLALVDQLRPVLPDPAAAATAQAAIRDGLARSWLPALPFGVALALLNANFGAIARSPTFVLDASLAFGQCLLWVEIAQCVGMRVVSAIAFGRLGEQVRIDLFRLDRLRPLARSGLADVLLVAGAVALSPLQSLDAEFRWYNYHFALIVAIPTAAFQLLWPLRHVHARIRAEKVRRVAEADARLEAAADLPDDLLSLETTLAHRDRLREQHTWLLSFAMLSRLVLYLIIPPLAWVAAAIVERLVDRMLGF